MSKKKFAVLTSGWSVDYVLSTLQGMREACKKANADLYVFTFYRYLESKDEANTTGFAIFDLINYQDYDGIIIMPNLFNDDRLVEIQRKKILESGIPAVSLIQPLEGLHFINSENHLAYKKLILHLINEHKLSHLCYIGGPDGNAGSESNYKAFVEAIKESGLNIKDQIFAGKTDWSYDTAYQVAKNLFTDKNNLPQAVVCVNDWAAMATIRAAEENGIRVPQDLKIVGFDNISISDKVIPSISSVDINANQMGIAAIELLLSKPKRVTSRIVYAETIIRSSCGCVNEITPEQVQYSMSYNSLLDKEQQFASQLRHLEDTFIKHETLMSLTNNLQTYFEKRHLFEGPDFAILINQGVIDSLQESIDSPEESRTFDEKLKTIVNIQNGKPSQRFDIDKRQLIPENMISEESTLYLFLPIFNQKYLHGYYLSKNCLDLLLNKSAYNWTRNFGTIIEKFRQTSVYRYISEQLKVLSTKDSLSDLLNRAGLDMYGFSLFERNNEEGIPTQIIFVDINDMKTINDKYGHLQGDLAVKTVADSIAKEIPQSYIAVRYGGDEFVIIGPYLEEIDYCKKIENHLAQKVKKMTLPYNLTASFGSKIFAANERQDLLSAIKVVDEIMYKNKLNFHSKK
ncbi:MAG: GGDEF domain-containing protein [Treponema sp.]|nr:GGDEF domain-containing protein [Treponema sp.]